MKFAYKGSVCIFVFQKTFINIIESVIKKGGETRLNETLATYPQEKVLHSIRNIRKR